MKWLLCLSLVMIPLFPNTVRGESAEGTEPLTVSSGEEVSIEYTLKLEDHSTVDSNVGAEPLKYIQGNHEIIPGLETALEGLKVGDQREIKVAPADGYGEMDPTAFEEVDKSRIPPEALVVGTPLEGQDPSGRPIHAKVHLIKESTVVLDMNHPLAGKTLYFDVKILGIQAPDKNRATDPPESSGHSK
jgi:FKBP-type peptidyl-prolyl cis-trans isomerase SlyD